MIQFPSSSLLIRNFASKLTIMSSSSAEKPKAWQYVASWLAAAVTTPRLLMPDLLLRINVVSLAPSEILDAFQLPAAWALPDRRLTSARILDHAVGLRQNYGHWISSLVDECS
jgi:hypothetical protein